MITSDKVDDLFKALDAFHNKSPLVKATKENPFHKNKYADYNAVVSSTRGDLQEQGLRVKQVLGNLEGKLAVTTRLIHITSMQYIEDTAPVAHKEFDPQSQGSGVTYMKRYAYVAMLDLLVDADDDGNLGAELGKSAEKNKKVTTAIALIESATSEVELKKTFLGLADLKTDKRIIAAKDQKKSELTI